MGNVLVPKKILTLKVLKEKLLELKAMLDEGLLSEEEHKLEKEKVLGRELSHLTLLKTLLTQGFFVSV